MLGLLNRIPHNWLPGLILGVLVVATPLSAVLGSCGDYLSPVVPHPSGRPDLQLLDQANDLPNSCRGPNCRREGPSNHSDASCVLQGWTFEAFDLGAFVDCLPGLLWVTCDRENVLQSTGFPPGVDRPPCVPRFCLLCFRGKQADGRPRFQESV